MLRHTTGIPCQTAIEMNFLQCRLHFLALLAACLTLLSAPATATDPSRISLEIDGTYRRFHFYAPSSLDAPAPLMIVLHGSGSTGPGLLAEGKWRDKADREGFVLAAPDSLISYDGVDPRRDLTLRDRARQIYRRWRGIDIGRWEGGPNDLKLIATLIDRMDSEARIDRSRIYVAGFSRGGFFAQLLGLRMADRIAAIAVVAPNMEPKNVATTDRPVPFLLMVGALDAVMPAEGPRARALFEFWRERDRCPPATLASAPGAPTTVEIAGPCAENGEVRYVVVGGVDHLWPPSFTDRTWEFLSRFRRTD
jgi:polyhydroxybutyrate depolymerase